MSSSETEILFWWVAMNTFTFLYVYDTMRIVLLKWNGQMLMKWLSEQLWRCCSCIYMVHLKKCEYHEKGQYFLSLISESETHILYRFITHSEIFQTFISWNFDDYGLQIMKTQNSVSQKIFILHKINKKIYILNRNVRLLKKSMFISMHSILGWASFCMNYWINAAWHGANQPVALLRCNGSPGCFDSRLQVICIVGSGGVSHLPLDNTP